jgi:hypothetical protein
VEVSLAQARLHFCSAGAEGQAVEATAHADALQLKGCRPALARKPSRRSARAGRQPQQQAPKGDEAPAELPLYAVALSTGVLQVLRRSAWHCNCCAADCLCHF